MQITRAPAGALLPAPRSSPEPFSTLLCPTTGIFPPGFPLPSGLGPGQRIPLKSKGRSSSSSSMEACWVKDAAAGPVFLRTQRPAFLPNPPMLLCNFPCHTDTPLPLLTSLSEKPCCLPHHSLPQGLSFPLHLYHCGASTFSSCSCLCPNLPVVPTNIK